MKANQNYKDYVAGKAKLNHAMHTDPTDKVINMINANTSHRFWVNDYKDFKKKLATSKPYHKVFGLNENIQTSSDGFFELSTTLRDYQIDLYDFPKELYDDSTSEMEGKIMKIDYTANVVIDKGSIYDVHFRMNKIDFNFHSVSYNEDTYIAEKDDEYHLMLKNLSLDKTDINKYKFPLIMSNIEIRCFNTVDTSKWKIETIDFGKINGSLDDE